MMFSEVKDKSLKTKPSGLLRKVLQMKKAQLNPVTIPRMDGEKHSWPLNFGYQLCHDL